MAIIKCKMCGGELILIDGASTAECEFCGSVQTIPNLDDEKKLIQFERAERLRKQCEFDKAAGIYETIVADYRQEAEAYWGLVLCKYGIEYVDDPATGKKIPTCHRSSFDSIMEDGDFEQVLENADVMARKVYREEAKQIEEIRKGIIAVSANEEPYDIFICYKETDESGDRTIDSVLAQDVYDALTDKGYCVFFSRITLEGKLGVEYEPYIFAALNSAKIMLVFGTDYEYFNAVWVKNEWSRYLKLMAKDKTKHLIPCFKGIDAYDMPKEFARLQAQDLGKIGATQDLLRGIAKILAPQVSTVVVAQKQMTNTSAMVKRGQFALDDGDWEKADEYFEKALDENPEESKAYVGKVLTKLHLSSVEQINDYFIILEDNKDFDRAIRFATGADKAQLESIKANAHLKWLVKCLTNSLRKISRAKKAEVDRIAREESERRREEEELREQLRRKQEEQHRKEVLSPIRNSLAKAQGLLSAGQFHTVGLKSNGTVDVAYNNKIYNVKCDVSDWTDIVAISAHRLHTVGLKSDGTVVAVGDNDNGQCNVSDWTDIVAISGAQYHTVGLKSNGTVIAVGYGNKINQNCDVSGWTDIVAISAGDLHTVGLKSDGTVVAASHRKWSNCNVSNWTDIVAISAGNSHTVGLKSDGTVVAVGFNSYEECDVSNWADIVAISAGFSHTVGLKSDGTVVAAGDKKYGKCDVSDWTDIVAISAGFSHTVGLKSDGTVVAVGDKEYDKCKVSGWKLFDSFHNLEQERESVRLALETQKRAIQLALEQKKEAERLEQERRLQEEQQRMLAQKRRASGLCQHCGGELKGFFSKKCVSCGKPKDY